MLEYSHFDSTIYLVHLDCAILASGRALMGRQKMSLMVALADKRSEYRFEAQQKAPLPQ